VKIALIPKTNRRRLVPVGPLVMTVALIFALCSQVNPPSGPNALVGPGGTQLHIQKASDDLGTFTPYSPGELWGGQNLIEQCLPCQLQTASGKPEGQSLQPGQQVNPATGDFSFNQSLFSVPAAGGANLGVTLTYDAQEAETQDLCLPSSCTGGISAPFPNFGYGWQASLFPTVTSFMGDLENWLQVTEPNGSDVDFYTYDDMSTCESGGMAEPSYYTLDFGALAPYCAAYRVNAQIAEQGSGQTSFAADDGQIGYTFSTEYGTPQLASNLTTATLTYSTLVTPGSSGCPSYGFGGTIAGCYLVSDFAGRTTTVVIGTPSINPAMSDNVLDVIDPGSSQTYDVAWYAESSFLTDEPESISQHDSYTGEMGDLFDWQGDGTVNQDNMIQVYDYNVAGAGEQISYYPAVADEPDLVHTVTDAAEDNTTSYSYEDMDCGACLGSDQATTVNYPDGEQDVDNYTDGVFESIYYGTGADTQSVTYQIDYPDPDDPDGPIAEWFFGPVEGEETLAQTDGVGDILYLLSASADVVGSPFTASYNYNGITDQICWSAPGGYTSPTCGSPPSGSTVYLYNSDEDVKSVTDPLGNKTRYGYYTDNMVCWVAPPTITASGGTCGAVGSAPIHVPAGSTAYQYDDYGDLACQFVADGKSDQTTTAATYNTDGRMTQYDPPDSIGFGAFTCGSSIPTPADGTTYSYTHSQLTTQTAPNDQVTQYTYNDGGLLEEVQDPTGITINAYDGDGRLCWTSRLAPTASVDEPFSCGESPAGTETSYSYLADTDAKATVTDARGKTTTYGYDNTAYPTSPTEIQDPANEAVVYNTYDENGNVCDTGPVPTDSCGWTEGDTYDSYDIYGGLFADVVLSEDPNGNQTSYAYTNTAFPHLVTQMTEPDGTSSWNYQYNGDGQEAQSEDPEGNYITINYDADGRKCWQAHGTPSNSCSSPPTALSDSSWTYNFTSTVATMVDHQASGAETTTYSYDADGNQTSVDDDNGNTVLYAYNASDQLSCVGYPGASNCDGTPSATNPIVTYGYDPTTNLLDSTTDWLGNTTTYGYSSDGLNNLTSIDYPTSGSDSVAYGYNADSEVNSETYGGSSLSGIPSQSWGYNIDDLINSATQLDAPGGTISSYTSSPAYDSIQNQNWIASNTNPGSSAPDVYLYAPNGEMVADASGSTTTYGYNSDNELCWSSAGSGSSCTDPPSGTTTTYTSTTDGQRCWSAPSSIDSASCSTPPSSGATGYAWNSLGELCWSGPISAIPNCTSPPSDVTQYTYDGNGLRTTETSTSGVTQDFTWLDSSSTPLLLEDGTNAYIYGPSLFGTSTPVEQIKLSTSVARYLTVAPSGVQLVLNQGGSILNESSYSTYGVQTNSGSLATPFGFQGSYTDPSGLIYLLNRYYDPSTGQFLSIDPDLQVTGQPYGFAGDDPVNFGDPNGQMETCGSNCGPDSGDIGGPGGIACSENCGTQISSAQSFLWWLSQQSSAVIAFFECAAGHSVEDCENLFSGDSPASNQPSAPEGTRALSIAPQTLEAVSSVVAVSGGIRTMVNNGMIVIQSFAPPSAAIQSTSIQSETGVVAAATDQIRGEDVDPDPVEVNQDPMWFESGGGIQEWSGANSSNSGVGAMEYGYGENGGGIRYMDMG
jgi:RHS repeat-associated protein